jgi:hypothetical protein
MRTPGRRDADEPLATFARQAVSTSQFYPALERFVRFERLPFMDPSPPDDTRAIGKVYKMIKEARDRMRVLSLTLDAEERGGS